MRKLGMMRVLRDNIGVFLLTIIVLVITSVNYQPGTWLTGWDNLHPEFNFSLNIKRSLFAVWQEYQGLGLLGGMGHAADLPRQIFLWAWSLILPAAFLRYFYTFLMFGVGPVGVYYLIRELKVDKGASFFGGLFYLLNLVTVQIFYTPFEPFISHYGFLPWLLLVFLKFMGKPSRGNFIFLALVNLLAIPQGYVPTVFLVYILSLGLVWIGRVGNMGNLGVMVEIKRFGKVLATIFIINAFWLLPFLYFTYSAINNQLQSHVNFMVTDDIYQRNKKFGDLQGVVLGKSFWFDYVENEAGSPRYLISSWRTHLGNKYIQFIGYDLFMLVLFGIYYSWKKGLKYRLSFLLLFLLTFCLLANDTFPFALVDNFWRKFSLIAQVFRSPFTKFANLAVLSWSVFFGLGMMGVLRKLGRLGRIIMAGIVGLALVVFVWPVFSGKLIEDKLRLKIPDEYSQLFDFFESQDQNTRVANLPQPTYLGWNYSLWGYHGSGFLWYGVSQPILDRAFDVWNGLAENYYWELSRAIYADNLASVEAVLEKYQINWLVLDENIRSQTNYKALYFEKTEELLARSGKVKLVQEFGGTGINGGIKVYQVNLRIPVNSYVFLTNNLSQVGPKYSWNDEDTAYKEVGNYTSTYNLQLTTNNYYYPFRSLFTGRQTKEREFAVEDKGNYFVFKESGGVEGGGQIKDPGCRQEHGLKSRARPA